MAKLMLKNLDHRPFGKLSAALTFILVLTSIQNAYSVDLKFNTEELKKEAQQNNGMLFGTSIENVLGVISAVEMWWEGTLPNDPKQPADSLQNFMFSINMISSSQLDAGNPADTTLLIEEPFIDKPFNGIGAKIEINNQQNMVNMMWWDETPHQEEETEFKEISKGKFMAVENGPAHQKLDMLTVLKHEVAHVLAFNSLYADFGDSVDFVWNKQANNTQIDSGESHFKSGMNLMTEQAGLPDGKSGRVRPQEEDLKFLESAFFNNETKEKAGYVVNRNFMPCDPLIPRLSSSQDTDTCPTVPEPNSTLSLLALGTLGVALTLKRKLKPSKSAEKELEKVS